jgi:hypothetical protein
MGNIPLREKSRGICWRDFLAPLALWLVAAACASPVHQENLSQPLAAATGKSFRLESDVKCTISTGYSRVLKGGSRWEQFGVIEKGDVYHSPDQTLTVEGSNVHEAFIVTKDEWLVGFYLPVEKTFTPVSKSMKLTLTIQ